MHSGTQLIPGFSAPHRPRSMNSPAALSIRIRRGATPLSRSMRFACALFASAALHVTHASATPAALVYTPAVHTTASVLPAPVQSGPIISLQSSAFTDGAITPASFGAGSFLTIDLALAVTGDWATANGGGAGVYDPAVWAVVFKFTSVSVPSGRIVRFLNHPSGAPVVWLVEQSVTIDGTVDVSAKDAVGNEDRDLPGPGGFRGRVYQTSTANGAGFGPGGGFTALGQTGSGNFAGSATHPSGTTYGSPSLFPLIGGSGGSSSNLGVPSAAAAGAGGGAILIACNGTVQLGTVLANGTSGGGTQTRYGSGGAIRIVASAISFAGTNSLRALGWNQVVYCGRIRLEAPNMTGLYSASPLPSVDAVPGPLLPDPQSTPSVSVTSVTLGAQSFAVPADPRSLLSPVNADVIVNGTGNATVHVVGRFIAPGSTVHVRVTDAFGDATVVQGTLVGTLLSTTADVPISRPAGVCAVQARAVF